MNRRAFLGTLPVLGVGGPSVRSFSSYPAAPPNGPVLRRELFPDPIFLESVDLLRHEDSFLCRVRSSEGAEGWSVANNYQQKYLWPIQTLRVNPFFVGKDARDLDALIDGVYTYRSNYKLQSLALWVPVATVEFAILDLLGKIAGLPLGKLLSPTLHNPEIKVYQANNHRGKSAEESLDRIVAGVAETGAEAVKFKVAGRMNDPDLPAGRSERLIPLVRRALGDDMTLYADANSGYDIEQAVRIGHLMADHGYDFFEEPIAFDRYTELRQVKDRVGVPLAGGEQEASMNNFRYLIEQDVLAYVQPDLFYFGGMVRSMRVARMAAARGQRCVPHISGAGLGFLYMAHFVSALPNAGPYHEFKAGVNEVPYEVPGGGMEVREGKIRVPEGAGLGVVLDPDFVSKHRVV